MAAKKKKEDQPETTGEHIGDDSQIEEHLSSESESETLTTANQDSTGDADENSFYSKSPADITEQASEVAPEATAPEAVPEAAPEAASVEIIAHLEPSNLDGEVHRVEKLIEHTATVIETVKVTTGDEDNPPADVTDVLSETQFYSNGTSDIGHEESHGSQQTYIEQGTTMHASTQETVTTATTETSVLNGARLTTDYRLTPSGSWPPPIYVSPNADENERFYIEWRWHSQWAWYDKRASEAKWWYQRLQILVVVGSVTVPVLVGLNTGDPALQGVLQASTVIISLMVAIAAGIEGFMKYGDNWRTFRAAAEELTREKTMYDVRSGPYRRSKNPFMLFTERCEDVIAKQNGNWLKSTEEQETKGGEKKETTQTQIQSYAHYTSEFDATSYNADSDVSAPATQQSAPTSYG